MRDSGTRIVCDGGIPAIRVEQAPASGRPDGSLLQLRARPIMQTIVPDSDRNVSGPRRRRCDAVPPAVARFGRRSRPIAHCGSSPCSRPPAGGYAWYEPAPGNAIASHRYRAAADRRRCGGRAGARARIRSRQRDARRAGEARVARSARCRVPVAAGFARGAVPRACAVARRARAGRGRAGPGAREPAAVARRQRAGGARRLAGRRWQARAARSPAARPAASRAWRATWIA